MGLNRMMMKNGVKVEDGRKFWTWNDANNKTISFTVPSGVKRIKVTATVDYAEDEPDAYYTASITNTATKKYWGEGYSQSDPEGRNEDHQNIAAIVGVTPSKTYELRFDCGATSGVTFSWGQAINAMTPTVEDY